MFYKIESAENVWTLTNLQHCKRDYIYSIISFSSTLLIGLRFSELSEHVFANYTTLNCIYMSTAFLSELLLKLSEIQIIAWQTWFLFDYSFQSEIFYWQIELFRTIEACFWKLGKIKLYSSQKCFLSSDFAQNVWIWPNYIVEIWFNLFHHSFYSEVFFFLPK